MVRWYALSHGIPAESYATGANPVPKWVKTGPGDVKKCNVDMATDCNPAGPNNGTVEWVHSYFIKNSLFDTKVLYETLAKEIGLTKSYSLKPEE